MGRYSGMAVIWGLLFGLSALADSSCEPFDYDPKIKECVDKVDDIADRLKCLPSIKSLTPKEAVSGYRRFDILFDQPTDHAAPTKERFQQELVLLHLGNFQPMVLETSGYSIFRVALSKLAATFGANQLQVEHRFFDQSVPASRDWSKLNIKQSADDFHRITWEFRHIYRKPWVNTGRSKGGMTSVYHRFYYPNDVVGTVANVAPLSFSTADERYIPFVNQVGGESYRTCREKLRVIQTTVLKNRDQIVPKITGSFTHLGSADLVLEHAALEFPFAYWQYNDPKDPKVGCDQVPSTSASLDDMLAFLKKINDFDGFDDKAVGSFMPYYFQAATELGSPASDRSYLAALLKFPYSIDQYTPKKVKYAYSSKAMEAVTSWVRKESSRLLFVYGEFDPWTAGAFPYRPEGDSHKFMVPAGHHGSLMFDLPESKRSQALEATSRWIHTEADREIIDSEELFLEQLEFQYERENRGWSRP